MTMTKKQSTEVTTKNGDAPPTPNKRSLAEQLKDRGISHAAWHTLTNSLYPGARPESVLLVIDYCRARNLDPIKRPVHIVPMKVKDAVSGDEEWRDVVLPGVYEHRVTAHRTGQYLGHTPPEYGPEIEFLNVKAPEWVAMTMRRLIGDRVAEFPVRTYFKEVVGTSRGRDGKVYVNARWTRSPIQMTTKCGEAAGLREAFPEELGGQMTAEEADAEQDSSSVPLDVSTPRALPEKAVEDLNRDLGIDEIEKSIAELDESLPEETMAQNLGLNAPEPKGKPL